MQVTNRRLSLEITGDSLVVTRLDTGAAKTLAWPAVRLVVEDREIVPTAADAPVEGVDGGLRQCFAVGDLRFTVTLALPDPNGAWWRKRVSVTSATALSTPDFLEVEQQSFPGDDLRVCGYRATTLGKPRERGQEEATGALPACGYPAIGREWFLGLEHPAAVTQLNADSGIVSLWHFPVWGPDGLEEVAAVCGWADDARRNFARYLDTIRIPPRQAPLVSFCTFWSDPYAGDSEYVVSFDAYAAYMRAFEGLGLRPDVFTLDAGWQDRQSFFGAKQEVGGDAGLRRLRELAESMGSALGLWVSHNGSMGIAPEYLQRKGLAVGGGESSAYSGTGYGVMMDRRFAGALSERFHELVADVGVRHLKIDWDNECATNDAFRATYPTPNHVRQATVNAFFTIARRLRAACPELPTRSGMWASPWWLREGTHIVLSDGGDSEYAALPSRTQRDAATTHRDLMYYNSLQRDASALPLDCWDNHEFPDATRNPFCEDPVSWANAAWLAFLRGTTYITLKLMPESLEDWQAGGLRQIMRFARTYAKHLYVPHGRMVLGHPGRGEVYGFVQPGSRQTWAVLRNPLPIPQTVRFDPSHWTEHAVGCTYQYYPHHDILKPECGVTLLAHEVKALIFKPDPPCPAQPFPFMAEHRGARVQYRFPASREDVPGVGPMVHATQRVPHLECQEAHREPLADGGTRLWWWLAVPYRLRDAECQLCLRTKPGATRLGISARTTRYPDGISSYTLPVTHIHVGMPGHGERRNLDVTCAPDRTYAAVRLPAGGQYRFALELEADSAVDDLEDIWIAGYEAPTRQAVAGSAPPGFSRCLPYQHPHGFGLALKLPVPD